LIKKKTVTVALDKNSYDIHIGQGILRDIAECLPVDLKDRTLFILADENVSKIYARQVYDRLKAEKPKSVQLMEMPAGEQTKSLSSLEKVLSWLLDHGVERSSVLFAVGGGVIGDLAGFAAATVLRGISFVQVPTTLLAQVDSAVGGKTGVNMVQGKNLVGVFYQPLAVVSDIETLKTLPKRQILAGYAEIVKYGLIDDPSFFIWLEKEGHNVCALEEQPLVRAIDISCCKKAEIVRKDEKEQQGIRALLNLGHTFGHALETASGYDNRLLHGEAVAVGLVLAFRLSYRLRLCPEEDVDRVISHLAGIGLPTKISMITPTLEASAEDLMSYFKLDKKSSRGVVTYIVAAGIGKAHICRNVLEEDVKAVLEHSIDGK